MRHKRFPGLFHLNVVLAITIVGGTLAGMATTPVTARDAAGVATIEGTLSLDLAADPLPFMGLIDMTGFVRRDYNYVQGDSLIVGWIDHATGDYRIDLPAAPAGPLNDVGHGAGGSGVQIYSVDLNWNVVGDERLSPWEFLGWSWGNTSIKTAHGTHEVVGGRLAVWASDAAQMFPTDFGADGKLFTDDDPTGPIPSGWTVVDLDERPFSQNRSSQVVVDVGQDEWTPDDLSQLPATQAFDQMVDILRARYPFGDSMPIDWDGLRSTYRPEFEAAEQSGEQSDFWVALNHFLIALRHWSYFAVFPWADYFATIFLGSTGLHVDVSDDDKVIVAAVDPGQAAEQAGISAGAEIVTWNGVAARQAVAEAVQVFTDSSPQTILAHKTDNFGRLPAGTVVHVEYRNPGSSEISSTDLTAVEIPDEDIGFAVHCYRAWQDCHNLHSNVWMETLPEDLAVIHVQMFVQGMQGYRSVIDAWEQALSLLNSTPVRGLIIDLRHVDVLDSPTMPIYLAGSFFDEPFPLADVTSVDTAGNTVTVGTLNVLPAPIQWDRPVAILVDQWCKNVCEAFVLALTHRPDTIIAGLTATGGSWGSTTESVLLPTGNFVLVMDQAYRDPATHEILVEGKGIEPTLHIPKTAETIVENVATDLVLDAAAQALLAQIETLAATPAP